MMILVTYAYIIYFTDDLLVLRMIRESHVEDHCLYHALHNF